MTRAAALPQAPAQGGLTNGRVRTDFLDGLLGYNARRSSLHLVACPDLRMNDQL